MLSLKLTSVRLLNNDFYQQVKKAEDRGDSVKELQIYWEEEGQKKECLKEMLLKENSK